MAVRFLGAFFLMSMLISCGGKKDHPKHEDNGLTYFSVTDFANDQFRTYWGQPFTLLKIVSSKGKVDSSYIAARDLDWAKVLQPFFRADISDPKFLGKYNYSELMEEATDTRVHYYEAKEDDLFVRMFQINTDPLTSRIRNIYIETEKDGKLQKLYYAPIKLIQIQEFEKSMLGSDKNIKTEYRFLY